MITHKRNQHSTTCRDCGKRIKADGGFLYAKRPEDTRWWVQCDACHAKAASTWRGRSEPPPWSAREEFLRTCATLYGAPPCYRHLGLDYPASEEDIRAAFRRQALEVHPDKGGDAAAFIALRDARDEALRMCRSTAGVMA